MRLLCPITLLTFRTCWSENSCRGLLLWFSRFSCVAQLEQELEELRKEKLHRLLMDEASMLLQERGIDPGFASFVLAEDSAATRKKVEQFDRRLADTLRKHLTDRLPVREPKDFRAAKIPQRRRGIRKVS